LAMATSNSTPRGVGKTRRINELRTKAQANLSPSFRIVQWARRGDVTRVTGGISSVNSGL